MSVQIKHDQSEKIQKLPEFPYQRLVDDKVKQWALKINEEIQAHSARLLQLTASTNRRLENLERVLGETDQSVRISRGAGTMSYGMQEMAPQTIIELSEEMQEKDIENVQTEQEMKPEDNKDDLNRLKR